MSSRSVERREHCLFAFDAADADFLNEEPELQRRRWSIEKTGSFEVCWQRTKRRAEVGPVLEEKIQFNKTVLERPVALKTLFRYRPECIHVGLRVSEAVIGRFLISCVMGRTRNPSDERMSLSTFSGRQGCGGNRSPKRTPFRRSKSPIHRE